MFRWLLGVLLVGLLSVTLLQPQPASAQTELWCWTFDFTESDGGWTSVNGTWTDGVGWVGVAYGTGGGVTIQRSFTEAQVQYQSMIHTASGYGAYQKVAEWVNGGGTPAAHFLVSDPEVINGTDVDSLYDSFDQENMVDEITVYADGETSFDMVITSMTLGGTGESPFEGDNCDGTTGPDWIRPLLEADENTVGGMPVWDQPSFASALFDGPPTDISNFAAPDTQFRVMAMSNAPGAPVLAAQSGTVVDIAPYSGDMCSVWGALLTLGAQCWFGIPTSGTEAMALYQFPITEDLHQVKIEIAGGTELRYLVYNASRYIHLNQEISAGCALGETIQAEEVFISQQANIVSTIIGEYFSLGGLLSAGTEPGFGITFIEERDPGAIIGFEMVQLLPKLTTYNETAYPCNLDASFQDCLLADSDLTNQPDEWGIFGDVQATEAGLNLRPNSHIEQVLNLPEGTTFSFRIGLYFDALDLISNPSSLTREVTFRVGDFTSVETIEASGEYQEYVVEVPEPAVDPGGLGYTVRIANTGGADTGGIIIAAACLSTEDNELNPRACYFQNYEFDTTAGWVTTEVQQGAGFIILGDADAVLQEVQLTANEDASPRTYRLEVDARIIAAPGETLDTNTGSATLYYSWDGVDTVGVLDLQWNLPGNPGYPDAYQTFSVDIVVNELTTDDFIIYTGFTDNDTANIALSRVCLSTDTETPTGGGVPGPFATTCNTIPVPTEDSFGLWTMYHWRNLDKFFNCKLMVLLNRWFKIFDEFRQTALKYFRWGISFINKGVNWSQSLFWWLNGHFRNIATGQVVTITDSGGCHDLFCAIVDVVNTLANFFTPIVAALERIVDVLLGVLVGTVNLFFAIIGGLVAFAVAIIIKLLSLFQLAGALLATIVGAYNGATPTAIPGMPMCGIDIGSSPLCAWIWATDNTFFSGRWGILWAVALSIFAVHLIIWAIGEFKDVLLKTWGSS